MVQSRWTASGKEKLASSGLNTAQAERLGIYEVPSAKLVHAHFEARPALIIPYFGIDGQRQKAHPQWPDFVRGRYLDKGTGIVDMATEKGQRYCQPPKTGVCAYFPKLLNWTDIAVDPDLPIFITEGELKAAAGCAEEWAVIGLGGVWNFRSTAEGFFFLPELEKVEWRRRKVFIVYDSDFATNPNICFAINGLADELLERGALPHTILLPDITEEGKTGLDDFLLQAGEGDFDRLVEAAQPLTLAKALWRMNREVAYVRDPGIIVEIDSGLKLTPSAFKEHSTWSTGSTSEQKMAEDGSMSLKKVPAAPLWLKWPLRRSVERVTFAPGEDRVTEENEYNQWKGWGVVPKKGSVEPFLKLTKYLFEDMEPGVLDWAYDWLAYPIQNPGVKMFTCLVVWGTAQGTGKSLIGYTMGEIYGKNFKEITDTDLEGDYTAWAENRQFIMGDDVAGTDNRQFANKLKRMITQRTMTINIKHIPQYEVPDCINYYFTANHADTFYLDDKDRRNAVVEVAGAPLSDAFYREYDAWLWGDGPAHLMQWLLDRKISKNFNPNARAPDTAAKRRMIRAGKGELTGWISDLLEHPAQYLVMGKMRHTRDMFTAAELASMYLSKYPNAKVTTVGLGKALSNAGIVQADGGSPIRAPDGTQGRYYILRNVERWKKSDRKKLEAHLKSTPVPRNEGKV
jgi:uncharacterized protein DUF5906/uncharacterized protein DUF3854